jgi:predicted DNA-binding transcriptional regulator YafY
MNRIDRMTGILLALQTQSRTAQQLAERFEVSRRTILRDIDALSQLHIPIAAISGPHGGYQLPADYSLPPVHLTADEATVMMLALSSLGLAEDSPLGATHRLAREKVLAVINPGVRSQAMANLEHLSVVSDTEAIDQALLSRLREAAAAGSWVEIVHVRQGESTTRTILPEQIYLAEGRWYVRAIDEMRSARRTFRVARISDCRSAPSPDDAADIVRAALSRDGEYSQPSNPEVIVHLTPRGVELARDHPDLRDHMGADNTIRFHCPESELPYYARELLRFSVEAEILAPVALREMVVNWLETTLKHHQIQ